MPGYLFLTLTVDLIVLAKLRSMFREFPELFSISGGLSILGTKLTRQVLIELFLLHDLCIHVSATIRISGDGLGMILHRQILFLLRF